MDNKLEVLSALHGLQDDMLKYVDRLYRLGFDSGHLTELKGAADVVGTWIEGVNQDDK